MIRVWAEALAGTASADPSSSPARRRFVAFIGESGGGCLVPAPRVARGIACGSGQPACRAQTVERASQDVVGQGDASSPPPRNFHSVVYCCDNATLSGGLVQQGEDVRACQLSDSCITSVARGHHNRRQRLLDPWRAAPNCSRQTVVLGSVRRARPHLCKWHSPVRMLLHAIPE